MSFHYAKNPTGEVEVEHVMEQTDPNENLLERVLSSHNMHTAWRQVEQNKGSPGIDKMTVADFPSFARKSWKDIRESIKTGSYTPMPVKRVEIPKPTGGTRFLGIPTVTDRLIQQAIYQVLMPIFEPEFSDDSYGFRPIRSAHHAIGQAQEYIQAGYRTVVDMDLENFFDTVDHDVLLRNVGRKVKDKNILRLIGKYLRAGVRVHGRLQPTPKGVPQGGPLSPLLANILLDDLDKELEKRGHKFVRYADDFQIFVKSWRAGKRVKASIQRFLERELKLKVNQKKSQVADAGKVKFLGFIFVGTKIRWSDTSFAKFKRKVKELTGRSWFVSMEYRYKKLAQYLRGWMNYYGISEYYRPIPEIDSWIRRRVRMCYWKQWRYTRTKVKNLLKLGARLDQAILTSLSRKGPWRCSKTLATQSGMSNKWLKEQGLISVKDLWVNIHYPATAR